MEADRQAAELEPQTMAEERAYNHQSMLTMFQYMQTLGAAQGMAPPALELPPRPPLPRPVYFGTPVSINVLVCMFMLTVKPSGV